MYAALINLNYDCVTRKIGWDRSCNIEEEHDRQIGLKFRALIVNGEIAFCRSAVSMQAEWADYDLHAIGRMQK